ncbi:MAG: cytochrome d ubiquinol oxidase subunit II [Jatrophihabitantaceae bacterium]
MAGDRVPPGLAKGDTIGSWTSPIAVMAGLLAVAACSFLAAAYLCRDAAREGDAALADWFRLRALGSGVVAGALAIATLVVTHVDAPRLFDGLTGRALALVLLSIVGGVATLVLVAVRRFTLARIAAALAVTGLVWGGGVVLTSLIGLALLVPSLYLLLRLFQQPARSPVERDGTA